MAYQKQAWVNLPEETTPISAERLTHIEDGIYDADQKAEQAKNAIPTKTSDLRNDSNYVSDANYTHTDNNFTNAYKDAIDNMPTSAQADWNESSSSAQSYIKNKPFESVGDGLKVENNVLKAEAQKIDVDDALSLTSENPVQNKVITSALNDKPDMDDIPTKTSELTNDSDFIDSSRLPAIDTNFDKNSNALLTNAVLTDSRNKTFGTDDMWIAERSYTVGYHVIHNNALWECVIANVGQMPSEGAYWKNVSLAELSTLTNVLSQKTLSGLFVMSHGHGLGFYIPVISMYTNFALSNFRVLNNDGVWVDDNATINSIVGVGALKYIGISPADASHYPNWKNVGENIMCQGTITLI